MSNLIEGDKDYVLNAINDAYSSDSEELPMEYFLEISYDETNGKVIVDLDLQKLKISHRIKLWSTQQENEA